MKTHTIRPQVALVVAVVAAILVASVAGCSSKSEQSSQSNKSNKSNSSTVNSAVAKKYPGCTDHMNDGNNAPKKKITNLRGVEYGEISLICGNGVATMYKSTYMNSPNNPAVPVANTQETAPLPLWNSSSEDSLALEYDAPSVLKNGPRFWVNDWVNLPIGPTLYFNGIYARWFAYPHYPPGVTKAGVAGNPYSPNKIERNSIMGFNAGQPIFVLVNNNTPYVMQAASMQINPNESIKSLQTLGKGNKLDLPSGWSYKVITLKKPLTLQAVNGAAIVTTDKQGNTYDKCFKDACSYNPLTGK